MRPSLTLFFYLARHYCAALLVLLIGLMGLIYFFDTLELLRRASKFDTVSLTTILQMSAFKLPEVTQTLLPTAILLSAIYTFWSLTQKLELIIIRAAGYSAIHFLIPLVTVAVLFGALHMTVINPISTLMLKQYEKYESRYLNQNTSNITLFEDGLWLQQNTDDGYSIIHSETIKHPDWRLNNVTALFFDQKNSLKYRVDAPEGVLRNQQWEFSPATLHEGYDQKRTKDRVLIPTHLTPQDIEDSFAAAQTISFWKLPSHITTLEASGFNPSKLRVHYHALLAQPIFFAAMVLIAAGVAMHLPRSGPGFVFILSGIFTGVALFFIANFMQALGASQQIPVALAAWSPAILSLLLGISLILHIEEE